MAPKEKFPKEMVAWFQSVYPEFDAKLGISKPQLPGQPVPTDDPDLRSWKKKKREEFENKFTDALNQVDDWRGVSYSNYSFTPSSLNIHLSTALRPQIYQPQTRYQRHECQILPSKARTSGSHITRAFNHNRSQAFRERKHSRVQP
jgi:hypothetical protein